MRTHSVRAGGHVRTNTVFWNASPLIYRVRNIAIEVRRRRVIRCALAKPLVLSTGLGVSFTHSVKHQPLTWDSVLTVGVALRKRVILAYTIPMRSPTCHTEPIGIHTLVSKCTLPLVDLLLPNG